ncbi:MAG TPA: hypothetical protein VFT50_07215 [Baekduia sp.]|nr:hypothetical protein [Baekduia sp.]
MALDDFLDSEVGIAAAATAIALSPRVRHTIRRGAVLGLAGAMKAADAVGSGARAVIPHHDGHEPAAAPPQAAPQTPEAARP